MHLADVIDCAVGRPPIDVRVPELGHRIEAPVSKRLERPAHHLRVLLRHRTPSIPQAKRGDYYAASGTARALARAQDSLARIVRSA